MNSKGMTLMELIVSVALISIIMIFMYKLISDVRYEKKENDKITDNILKTNEIAVDSVNEIVSLLNYQDGQIDTVEIWNDIWYNGDNEKIDGQYIRIDIILSEKVRHSYSIAIKKSTVIDEPFYLEIRKFGGVTSNSWTPSLKRWTLSDDVKDINIKENCNFNGKNLFCQFDLELKDSNNKIISTISYPLYFYTNDFKSDYYSSHDKVLERYCKLKLDALTSDDNCYHCPPNIPAGELVSKREKTNKYSYEKLYSEKPTPKVSDTTIFQNSCTI